MAKNIHPLIALQGTMAGFTFVDSTKYGSHIRAARGTHKKATCNDAFKKVSSRTALLNKALGPPYHFFKDRYYPFMNGVVWSQMQSRARRSEKDDLLSLMMTMEGLELNQRYSFANLVVDPDVTVTYRGQMIYVDFGAKAHPAFKKGHVNCYYYDISILFPGKNGVVETDSVSTEWVSKNDEVPSYELVFEKPVKAGCYLLVMKVQGGYNEKEVNVFGMMGVQVVKVGKC